MGGKDDNEKKGPLMHVVVKPKKKKRLIPTTWLARSKFYKPEASNNASRELIPFDFEINKRSVAPGDGASLDKLFDQRDSVSEDWELDLDIGPSSDAKWREFNFSKEWDFEIEILDLAVISQFDHIYWYKLYFADDDDDTVDCIAVNGSDHSASTEENVSTCGDAEEQAPSSGESVSSGDLELEMDELTVETPTDVVVTGVTQDSEVKYYYIFHLCCSITL